MIRRAFFAFLNGLINVLEAIVDDKRDRQQSYWLLPPAPAEDQVTKEYPPADVTGEPFKEPVETPWERHGPVEEWEDLLSSWQTDEPGGETP